MDADGTTRPNIERVVPLSLRFTFQRTAVKVLPSPTSVGLLGLEPSCAGAG